MQICNAVMLGIIVTGLLLVDIAGADSIKAELEKSSRHANG